MKLSWQTLEREIVAILKENSFGSDLIRKEGETFLNLETDFTFPVNLTTFAKELAKRLEAVK